MCGEATLYLTQSASSNVIYYEWKILLFSTLSALLKLIKYLSHLQTDFTTDKSNLPTIKPSNILINKLVSYNQKSLIWLIYLTYDQTR